MHERDLYEIEKTILKLMHEGKTSEEMAVHLNVPPLYLDVCICAIRRKTGAASDTDLLSLGQRLADADARAASEVTQERASRIQQCISALLLEIGLTEEEQEYLVAAREKWDARSHEKWRVVS